MELFNYDLTKASDISTSNILIKMNLQLINMGNVINALGTLLIKKGVCSETDIMAVIEEQCAEEETKELIDKMHILEKVTDLILIKLKGESLSEEDIEYIKENTPKVYSEDKVKEILSLIGE